MKKSDWIALFILLFIVIGLGVAVTQNMRLNGERQELINEIQELNREIGEYKEMEDFYWEYTDLLDEIYQGKINEAVLEERIKWLKEYTEWLEEQETVINRYTQEEMYEVIENLIGLTIEVNTDDMLDVSYDEQTKIFTIIEYNQYGEIFDTDTYTFDEIIHEILGK